MNEKINPRFSSAISRSHGKTKYVLEDVFWVPVSNCSSMHFSPPICPELNAEKPDIDEAPGSGESESVPHSNKAPCLKSQEEAGCAQIQEHAERNRPESPWRGTLSLVIALLNFVLIVWPLAAQAQVSNPTSPTQAQQFTVSVREMQVPAKARGAFLRGFERLAKGDAAGSLRDSTRAIQEFPGFYEAYYNKGIAETQLHQWNEAQQSFQKSIDLSGGHYACAYFGYSVVLAHQGRSKDAEPIVRRGLEEGPTSCLSFGYGLLSIVLFGQNRLDAAEEAAHKALLLPDPSRRNALLALAHVHFVRREYQLAVQDLEAYLEAARSTPWKDDAEYNQYIRKLLSEAKARSAEQNADGAS